MGKFIQTFIECLPRMWDFIILSVVLISQVAWIAPQQLSVVVYRALRALVRQDLYLWQRVSDHGSACDRMAFALSGCNGGERWRKKRQQRSTASGSFRVTGKVNPGVQPAFQQENEDDPVRILIRWQPVYASWGPGIDSRG